MSPLLVVGLVLLVVVVGLALMQRAQTSTPSPRRDPAAPPTRPPVAPTLASGRAGLTMKTDPTFGLMSYDGDMWTLEEDVAVGDAKLIVGISGTPDGPTERDFAIVRAAQARPDLDRRARALVLPELARRGADAGDMRIYQLDVGPDDDGALCGFIWYHVTDLMYEIGVSSTDHWQTLTLIVVD